MAMLTLKFHKRPRKRGAILQRSWFRDLCSFCCSIYGDEKHEELRLIDRESDLDLWDYVDLMLTTALPECRVHHGARDIEVEIDFENDADAVAFYLRHVEFDPS